MTDSVFNLTVDDNKIAVVTIDVPGEKMNTLRDSFADDLKGHVPLGLLVVNNSCTKSNSEIEKEVIPPPKPKGKAT